jgi:cell division protein FtsW
MRETQSADKILTIIFFGLVLFGLIMIYSAGVALSKYNFDTDSHYFMHQLLYGLLPGLVLWIIAQKIDYHIYEKFAFPLFLIAIGLLVLVFVPGVGQTYKGSARWIDVGPFNIQPTEIAKLALILYLAAWLSKREQKIKSFSEGFIPFVAVLTVMAVLIAKQPDIGTLGMITIIAVVIFFLARGKISHILLLVFSGILFLYIVVINDPVRMKRIKAYLNPEADTQGISYQVNQAKIAIGSGGLWGVGLGKGLQKFLYLPEPVGDSIFAIICEELGMAGGVTVILLFFLIAFRGYRITKRAPDYFGKLIAGGITSWFFFQAFINIGAISGLIPLTGIPLPFISYGSSALIVSLIGAGILLNVSKHADE